jgi:SEC-C motif-containing protein
MHCPCDSQKDYSSCCEPYITGKKNPETPEALMRSRYTAYTMADINYIKATTRHEALIGFQELDAKHWAKRVCWIKLKVHNSSIENANTGYVEFEAQFVDGSRLKSIHEKSKFIREEGLWYYVKGSHIPTNESKQTITRNTACPCGSLKKFKNCHGKDK